MSSVAAAAAAVVVAAAAAASIFAPLRTHKTLSIKGVGEEEEEGEVVLPPSYYPIFN